MSGEVRLDWAGGTLSLHPRGAMIRDLELRLPGGRTVHPLHRAPWVGTAAGNALGGLLAGLSGEWPCVPFGAPGPRSPPGWPSGSGWEEPHPHGFSANHDWTLSRTPGGIAAEIEMPADHPIERMTRHVAPHGCGVAIDLGVLPRRTARLPIGLHPVFALPDRVGALSVEIEGAREMFHHPDDPSPDPSPLAPGAVFAGLSAARGVDGLPLDLSKLPLDVSAEIRLLVPASGGRVRLENEADGTVATLAYDPALFPAVMLWISNRGRTHAPWSGRHLALGVEPVCAAFDLGTRLSSSPNPLDDLGLATAHPFEEGVWMRTRYAVTVAPLSSRA